MGRKTKGRDKIENKKDPHGKGRPPYVPTDKDREIVQAMVSCGIQYSVIADCLGVSSKTIQNHYGDELKLGAEKARATVVARLFRMTETNIRAVEFYLTNRDKKNWQHTQRVDVTQDTAKNLGDRLARAQAKLGKKK